MKMLGPSEISKNASVAGRCGEALSLLLLCFALAACNDTSARKPRNIATAKTSSSLAATQVKSRISAAEMDGASMRLNLFNVSYVESSRAKFPIISYSFPEKADYVQIIRCRSDAKLGDLDNVEIGASNTSVADEKYKTADYWKNISATFGCVVLSQGVSVDTFVDYYSNDGSWVYVGRACVHESRLPLDSAQTTVSRCSKQVSKTQELRGYVNRLKSISAEKKAEALAQRDRIDSLGRNIVYKAKQLDTDISRCEAQRGANQVSRLRREAVGKILGIGIGLGTNFIDDPATRRRVSGLDVQGIFKDLSAQAEDFLPPDFCPAAERLAKEIEIDKQQMEIEAESYNQSLKLFGEPV